MNAMTDVQHLRVPPHSAEAESAVLSALLVDNTAWDLCGDLVRETDFYRHEHKLIFGVVATLVNSNRTADPITVFERLQAAGLADDVGGLPYLTSLAQFNPRRGNLRRYAEIVREQALSRALVAVGDEIATAGFSQLGTIGERLDQATALILKLMPESATEDWVGIEQTTKNLLTALNARAEGKGNYLPTGLHDLDELLDGGLRPGELVIIGARPSMGKSALAGSIGMNVSQRGHAVGVFSMEMPKEEWASRQLSMTSHVHLSKLRRPQLLNEIEWSRITAGAEKLLPLKFYVSEHSGITINQLRIRARKLRRQRGLDLLVVDYLGLMGQTNPKDNRNTALGEATRGMKGLAKELGIPIICLAQLGREVEKRTGARPILSDLRDSGEIEQDADIVMFIDRPIMRSETMADEWKQYAEVIVAKQRNGSPGTVTLRYVGQNVTFLNWEGEKPVKPGRGTGSGL